MIGLFNSTNTFSLAAVQAIQSLADELYLGETAPEYAPPDPVPTGTSYYFAEDGSDSGLGTEASPWKTLDKMADLLPSLSAGDAVLFAMGDTFRFLTAERMYTEINMNTGTEESPIIFSRYWKTGDEENTTLPLLTGDTTQQQSFVSLDNNIWRADTFYGVGLQFHRDEIQQINSSDYSQFYSYTEIDIHLQEGTALYCRSTTDPSSSIWRYSNHKYIFHLQMNGGGYIIFNGLDTRWTRSGGADYRVLNAHNLTIQNCNIGKYSPSGVYFHGEWVSRGINMNVIYNTFDSGWRKDFSFAYVHSGTSIGLQNMCNLSNYADYSVVEHNRFIDFGHVALTFVFDPLNTDNKSTGSKWRYNYFSAPNSAYSRPMGGAGEYYDLEIAYNYIEASTVRNQIGGKNTHYHHNIFKDWRLSNKDNGAMNDSESSPIYDYIENSYPSDHIYENNIFYNIAAYPMGITRMGNNYIIQNNIFVNTCTGLDSGNYRGVGIAIRPWGSGNPDDFNGTINNNLFFDTVLPLGHMIAAGINYDEGVKTTVTVQQLNQSSVWAGIGNIEGNPSFVDTTEFRIQSTSPANDTGIIPVSTIDYDGNAIVAPYNIGTYNTEYDDGEYPIGGIPSGEGSGVYTYTDPLTLYVEPYYNQYYTHNLDTVDQVLILENLLVANGDKISVRGIEGANQTLIIRGCKQIDRDSTGIYAKGIDHLYIEGNYFDTVRNPIQSYWCKNITVRYNKFRNHAVGTYNQYVGNHVMAFNGGNDDPARTVDSLEIAYNLTDRSDAPYAGLDLSDGSKDRNDAALAADYINTRWLTMSEGSVGNIHHNVQLGSEHIGEIKTGCGIILDARSYNINVTRNVNVNTTNTCFGAANSIGTWTENYGGYTNKANRNLTYPYRTDPLDPNYGLITTHNVRFIGMTWYSGHSCDAMDELAGPYTLIGNRGGRMSTDDVSISTGTGTGRITDSVSPDNVVSNDGINYLENNSFQWATNPIYPSTLYDCKTYYSSYFDSFNLTDPNPPAYPTSAEMYEMVCGLTYVAGMATNNALFEKWGTADNHEMYFDESRTL